MPDRSAVVSVGVGFAVVVAAALLVRVPPGSSPGLPGHPSALPRTEQGAATPTAAPTAAPATRWEGDPPAIDPTVERGGGSWTRGLAPAPIPIPGRHVGVWTGAELVVGFEREVAAFDPVTTTWRPLPAHPDGRAEGRHAVWTGEEVVVVGGPERACARSSCPPSVVALDPATGTWRRLPSPPDVPQTPAAVVAAGAQVAIFWSGGFTSPIERARSVAMGAVYDVVDGEWTRTGPLRVGGARPADLHPGALVGAVATMDAVWTGESVVVWGARQGSRSFAALHRPGEHEWRTISFPDVREVGPGVWTDAGLVAFAGAADAARSAFTVQPEIDTWRPLPALHGLDDPRTSIYGGSAVWTGERVLFHGGYAHPAFLSVDPRSGEWAVLEPDRARVGAVAAWTGTAMLLWGGYTTTGADVDIVMWRPDGGG